MSEKLELADIYDAKGHLTGRVCRRGQPLGQGEFYLASAVTICNSAGEVFCTLRSPRKSLAPNMWESPGGGVLAGETSLEGAIRELREETGLLISEEELRFLLRRQTRDVLLDVYALRRDFPLSQVTLQPEETVEARWFPFAEWENLAQAGKILAGAYTDEFFAAVRRLAFGWEG